MTDMSSPEAVRRQYATEGNLQTRLSVWHPDANGRDPSQVALDAVVGAAPPRMLEIGCGTAASPRGCSTRCPASTWSRSTSPSGSSS